MTAIIDFNDVTKRHDDVLRLDALDLDVSEGEVLALLGHNGAGKTTIMHLILGLISPSSGSVSVLGGSPDGSHADVLRRRLGYLPENVSFYGQLSGREVLDYLARLKRADRRQVDELLARVGLGEASRRRLKTYSKGMRQRLGLAQALLGEPRLLLLDEPTTGLDPAATRDFYETVRDLRDRGCTVLLSSHVLPGVEPYIDRALILGSGRRLALGDMQALRREAALPLMIRARGRFRPDHWQQGWEDSRIQIHAISDDEMVLSAPAETKLAVLRRLTGSPDIRDIELQPPTLESLYTHFSAHLSPAERRDAR